MDSSLPIITGVIAVLLGGTGGALLARWLGRGRGQVILTSISRGASPTRTIQLSQRLLDLGDRYKWGEISLYPVMPASQLEAFRAEVQSFTREAPETLTDVRRIRDEAPRATNKASKVQLALEITTPRKLIRSLMVGALRRQEFTVGSSASETDEPIIPVVDAPVDNVPGYMMNFPSVNVLFSVPESFNPSHELGRLKPYVDAVSFFDVSAIVECMNYAERTLQTDLDLATALLSELDVALEAHDWTLNAILVNRGDRALLVHGYGALVTRGTSKEIAALPVKLVIPTNEAKPDRRERPARETQGQTLDYGAVPPQSLIRLALESDGSEIAGDVSALEAIYDQGLVDCALLLLQQNGSRRRSRRLQSNWVRFGAGLGADQRAAITSLKARK